MDGTPQQSVKVNDKMIETVSQGVPMFNIIKQSNAPEKQKQKDRRTVDQIEGGCEYFENQK
jgi:hypothetical protein